VLRHWAERHAIVGSGLEVNPAFLNFARSKHPARGRLQFVEAPAEQFNAEPGSYDIVLCLGAAFALGGFVQAVEWMVAAARPGGAVVIGDLTLKHRPVVNTHQHLPLDPLDAAGVVQRHGCEVSALISASDADFERYASHHRHATLRWAREHPAHPEHDEVLDKSRADWTYYLRTIRPMLGWTIFVGRKT
jgi:hypothetical protein